MNQQQGQQSPTNRKPRRWQYSVRNMLIGVAIFALCTGVITWRYKYAASCVELARLNGEVQAKIRALKARMPAGVPRDKWERSVDCTWNMVGQVYSLSDDQDVRRVKQLSGSLRQLSAALDANTQGPVDLTTLQWVWDECEKAPWRRGELAVWLRDVRLLTREPITDDDLPNLWSVKKCRYLDLDNTQVTDAGLVHLAGCLNLEYIYLRGTDVTKEGAAKLDQTLPRCAIRLDNSEDCPLVSSRK